MTKRKQKNQKIVCVTLVILSVLLLSACHKDPVETAAPTKSDVSTENLLTESTEGTINNPTGGSENPAAENSTEDCSAEVTVEDSSDIAAKKQKLLKEFWYLILDEFYSDYEGKDVYQISVCIPNFSPEDEEVHPGIYYNKSKRWNGCYLWKRSDEWEWFSHATYITDYSESVYQSSLKNSICVMNGTIEKRWNNTYREVELGLISTEPVYRRMIVNLGGLYEELTGGIEGNMQASLYLMDYLGSGNVGYWVCLDGEEPVYLTVTDDEGYQIDQTKIYTSDVPETAMLAMDVDLTTGKPEEDDFAEILEVTDSAEKIRFSSGYTATGIDYDGDGIPDEIREERDQEGRTNYVLYSGNGTETLLWSNEYSGSYLFQWIHQADVTGDHVPEVILRYTVESTAAGNHYRYVMWQADNGALKEISVADETAWNQDEMQDIPLMIERISDTQIRITVVGTQVTEVIEMSTAKLKEFWPAKDGQAIHASVMAKEDMEWYKEPSSDEYHFYATTRIGIAALTGQIVYLDGIWTIHMFELTFAEQIVSKSVTEAEKDGEALQNELWTEVVAGATVQVKEDLRTLATGNQGSTYDRVFCIPWATWDNVERKNVTVFNWDNYRYNTPTTYEGTFGLEGDFVRWQETDVEAVKSDDEAYEEIADLSNLVVETDNEVSLIGDPLGVDTEGYADRCTAAEYLFKAAMRYAAEWHLDDKGSFETVMRVWIYIVESTYDLDKPEGTLLIQMSEKMRPIKVSVTYDGSCREEAAGYTLTIEEENQSFYEVENAVCFQSVITTTNAMEWMYSVYQSFLEYDETNPYHGKYGEFAGEAEDFDGDRLTDRQFLYRADEVTDMLYVLFGSGEILKIDSISPMAGAYGELVTADLNRDGVQELIFCRIYSGTGGTSEYIRMWKLAENGYQSMPFRYGNGAVSDGLEQIKIPIVLEKKGDMYLEITQPECGKSVEVKVANESLYREETTSIWSDSIDVITDLENGKTILKVSGNYGDKWSFHTLYWEMTYEDGVWRVTDFYTK